MSTMTCHVNEQLNHYSKLCMSKVDVMKDYATLGSLEVVSPSATQVVVGSQSQRRRTRWGVGVQGSLMESIIPHFHTKIQKGFYTRRKLRTALIYPAHLSPRRERVRPGVKGKTGERFFNLHTSL